MLFGGERTEVESTKEVISEICAKERRSGVISEHGREYV